MKPTIKFNSRFSYLFLGSLLLLLLIVYLSSFFYHLPPVGSAEGVTLTIPKGTSLRGVSRLLADQQVIRSAYKFTVLGKVLGQEDAIHWGEYFFAQPTHPIAVLTKLTSGELKTYRITFPEGFTVKQMAETLKGSGFLSLQQFREYALSKAAADDYGLPGPTLEGYLYPTTYHWSRFMTVKQICTEMVAQFKSLLTPAYQARAKALGMNLREWVTLASIIEKETAIDSERPLIAAVFHNRLKQKMRLQADPTVIYGIADYAGNITKKHLQTYTPYNTYIIRGLPPGPIANPGKASMHAALYPAEVDYLYFVADQQGAHLFSRTYEEHRKKVFEYQINRRQ